MTTEERQLIVHCEVPARTLTVAHGSFVLANHATHLWFTRIADKTDRIPDYSVLLDDEEQTRAARFRFEVDRERFIIGHGLLRTLLGNYIQRPARDIKIERGLFGKPFVRDTRLRFNLSDTKDALVIAFALDQEIGVDLETMARTVDHVSVGEHYFTPEEIAAISVAADGKRQFLDLWTRKEAVLKASGVGIMEDLRVLRVDATENRMLINHESFVTHAAAQYYVRTWMHGDDHIISLASEGPIGEPTLVQA